MVAPASLDAVFIALADPTRRALIERLGHGPAAMSTLAEPFAIGLPTISTHLTRLADAGLVTSTKEGRVRTFSLVPTTLGRAEQWLGAQRSHWERRLDQLDDYLRALARDPRTHP